VHLIGFIIRINNPPPPLSWDSIGYWLDGLRFESCEYKRSASCSCHFIPIQIVSNQFTNLTSGRTAVLGNGVIEGLDGYLATGGHDGSSSTVGDKMF
jgi:hypothetical protein